MHNSIQSLKLGAGAQDSIAQTEEDKAFSPLVSFWARVIWRSRCAGDWAWSGQGTACVE